MSRRLSGVIFLCALLSAPVSAQHQLGMNLTWVNDYSTTFVFVDAFKASRSWISHRPSDDTWDSGEPFDLDETGWVRSLKPDQEAGTLLLSEIGANYPTGQYVCLYEGQGEIRFEWDARVVTSEPGRIVFEVEPEIGIHMVIQSTSPTNHVRNVRVLMPGFEATYGDAPFHPDYVDYLRQYSVLRFMDWGQTTENPPGSWGGRTVQESATQASIKGVALEYMIAMANTVGADAWFCVPHTADDDYVRNMAALIRDQLDPARKAYVEYSNEVWNPDFPQSGYARDQGLALGLSTDPEDAMLRFHSQRSVQIFDLFTEIFGGGDRLVRVMGGQADSEAESAAWRARTILTWNQAFEKTDAYAIAPYFGYPLGLPSAAGQLAAMTAEQILSEASDDMRVMLAAAEGLKQTTDSLGVALITYEAGQGMVPSGSQFDNPAVIESFHTVNRLPGMYDVYTEYLEAWSGFGGLMMLYTDIRRYDRYSAYGHLERWNQPLSEAPKMRAVTDFLTSSVPETSGALAGDFDQDGEVGFSDFLLFAAAFGGQSIAFDLDGDGQVTFPDFLVFAASFGSRSN